MPLVDPDLLFPTWRQQCQDDALDLVDRVLFSGSGATQPGLRPAWQDRLTRHLTAPDQPGPSRSVDTDLATLSGLVLVSDDEVNQNIASQRVVQALDDRGEWLLRDLAARCHLWRWQAEQAGFLQPLLLEPAVLVQTLCEALEDCIPHPPRRQVLMNELAPALTREGPALYQRQLDWLDSQGVAAQPLAMRRALPPAAGPVLAQTGGITVATEQVPALLAGVALQAGMSEGMRQCLDRLAPLIQRSLHLYPQLLEPQQGAAWQLIARLASLSQLDPGGTGTADKPALDQRLAPLLKALQDQPGPLSPQHYLRALAHADRLALASLPEPVGTQHREAEALNLQASQLELQPLILRQMADRLAPLDLLPGVRQFLLGPWVQLLTLSSARDGVDAASTQRWANAIDALVDGADRYRRQPLSPAQLDCQVLEARDGLQALGLPPGRVQQHLDDLHAELSHWPRMAMTRPDDSASLAAEVTDAERDHLLPTGSPDIDDSDWHHHADLATVPVDIHEAEPNSPAQRARQAWLDGLAPGQLCRIFLQGRWTSVRLDWISERDQFYAFSRRHGPAFSTSRRVLERMRAEGLVTSVDPDQWLREVADTLPASL
jgi:hypothetical protein